jgi:uncharacterized protein DUF6527
MIRIASRIIGSVRRRLKALASRFHWTPRLQIVRSDELPNRLSSRHLYVVGERGEDWYAAMICPCGCGATIDLNLVRPGRPCWTLTTHRDGTPTLSPSVCRQIDCRAHFIVRRGRIVWAFTSDDSRRDSTR